MTLHIRCSLLFVIVLLVTFTSCASVTVNKDVRQRESDGRFLSLFSVIRFNQGPCQGSTLTGTCMVKSDCTNNGGTVDGTCASSFGVCCIFVKSCGTHTQYNCTYFQNPGYPGTTTTAGGCEMSVRKCELGICQLRIDFIKFVLTQPVTVSHPTFVDGFADEDRLGFCEQDDFGLRGGHMGSFGPICGVNTGQHVYMDVSDESDVLGQVGVIISPQDTTTERIWNIKVSQIPCNKNYSPPHGCTQYFTDTTGILESFNFNSGNGHHMQIQVHHICIRPKAGYCSITYEVNPDAPTDAAFDIYSGPDLALMSIDEVPIDCNEDYLIIVGGMFGPAPGESQDRYCGNFFNGDGSAAHTTVTTSEKPFDLFFATDARERDIREVEGEDTAGPYAQVGHKGFSLKYTQNVCTT